MGETQGGFRGWGTAQGMFGCSYIDRAPDGDVDLLGGYEIFTQGEESELEI